MSFKLIISILLVMLVLPDGTSGVLDFFADTCKDTFEQYTHGYQANKPALELTWNRYIALSDECVRLHKDNEDLPLLLKACVCVLFKNNWNDLYWFSLGSFDLVRLREVVYQTSYDPRVSLVEVAQESMNLSELQKVFDRLVDSMEAILQEPKLSLASIASETHFQMDSSRSQERLELIRAYVKQTCSPLLNDKLLTAVWVSFTRFNQVTGSEHFSSHLLLTMEGPLKDMLITRGFCSMARQTNTE